MSRADGGRQNRLNFERKNNCYLNFKFGTRSFRRDFFGKRPPINLGAITINSLRIDMQMLEIFFDIAYQVLLLRSWNVWRWDGVVFKAI